MMRYLLITCCAVALMSGGMAAETEVIKNLLAQIKNDIAGKRTHRMKNPTYHLLAFVSLESRRPWYPEHALLLIKDETRWVLAHVKRIARYANGLPGTEWDHYHVMDAPWMGDRVFNQRPTEEEVLKFIKETRWQWHSEPDWFDVVGRTVNEDAWIKLLNMAPPVRNTDTNGLKPSVEVLDSNT